MLLFQETSRDRGGAGSQFPGEAFVGCMVHPIVVVVCLEALSGWL